MMFWQGLQANNNVKEDDIFYKYKNSPKVAKDTDGARIANPGVTQTRNEPGKSSFQSNLHFF